LPTLLYGIKEADIKKILIGGSLIFTSFALEYVNKKEIHIK
jgi:hypothetical protein